MTKAKKKKIYLPCNSQITVRLKYVFKEWTFPTASIAAILNWKKPQKRINDMKERDTVIERLVQDTLWYDSNPWRKVNGMACTLVFIPYFDWITTISAISNKHQTYYSNISVSINKYKQTSDITANPSWMSFIVPSLINQSTIVKMCKV